MKKYEIVTTFLNGCSGAAHPLTSFEEGRLASTDDYIRAKHGKDFENFRKEIQPDKRVVYTYNNGTVTYIYEFTEI